MILSDEQQAALSTIGDWYAIGDSQILRVFGPAGTGKSTLAAEIRRALNLDVVYGTYTGKAAHVLRRKGMPATTIHSAIYRPVGQPAGLKAELERKRDEWARLKDEVAPTGMEIGRLHSLPREIQDLENALRAGVQFELNEESAWGDADLIVIDEVSMIDERIARDILSFDVPVLAFGDPAQLPPIGGAGYWSRGVPDVMLRKVHRQALESPVLELATRIRRGQGFRPGEVVPVSLADAMKADQIIVWRNSTRWNLTKAVRRSLDRPEGRPVRGDRVICLQNNRDLNVLNGQQFEVHDVQAGFDRVELYVTDDDGLDREIHAFPEGFQGLTGEMEMNKNRRAWSGEVGAFTFANVITCNKSQGSEWDSVYVVDHTEEMRSDIERRRWMYTAITRARETVTVASRSV